MTPPGDFWPASGYRHLRITERGWLAPTDAYLRHLLTRPELAVVAESCAAEIALHQALQAAPSSPVTPAQLAAVEDADARSNYRHFLALRDGLLGAGTLESFYCGLFGQGAITLPPLFIDLIVQAIVRHLLNESSNAFEARAGELLFRSQRISLQDQHVLAGDRDTLDNLNDGAGFGHLGRLLAQAQAPLRTARLAVLTPDNAPDYWHDGERHRFVLDLTLTVAKQLSADTRVPLTLSHSGLAALARVLERWALHLLGVAVSITPVERIDDAKWRWHLGLDAEATELLNALYQGQEVDDSRLQRMVGLFRLDFKLPTDMHPDVAGRSVYLGLAMTAEQTLRLKPQNLLLNLPLARVS